MKCFCFAIGVAHENILLFLFAALTIPRGVAKSIVRSFINIGRIAGFDGAACAAGKR
jgi:hypothetical protein